MTDLKTCALEGCDNLFTPDPRARDTQKYCAPECRLIAKLKGDRERLPKNPNKAPWGNYASQDMRNVPESIAGAPVWIRSFTS